VLYGLADAYGGDPAITLMCVGLVAITTIPCSAVDGDGFLGPAALGLQLVGEKGSGKTSYTALLSNLLDVC
jgi:hypothetical protein